MSSVDCHCGKASGGNDGNVNTYHSCDAPCVHTCGEEKASWTVDLLDRYHKRAQLKIAIFKSAFWAYFISPRIKEQKPFFYKLLLP